MMLAASDEALASGDRAAADEYGWAAEALLDRIRARSRRLAVAASGSAGG